MDGKRWVAGRWLRRGYTTGACAAAAAKAAALLLLKGESADDVTITLANGEPLILPLEQSEMLADAARCAVKKDSGDDPDVTDGVLVYAMVRRAATGIAIDGGEGVGRVTKPGLDQPPGNAAINSGPRRMIERELKEVMAACGYAGGLTAEISIPGGAELAKRTFNPRLGVVDGLSVLGSTGILEPMSEAALMESIRAELAVLAAGGSNAVLITPGNYGEEYCREKAGLRLTEHVKCGNFVADTIEAAVEQGLSRILLVGHIGKLAKLGLGSRNTHSRHGDGRMPILMWCALKVGGTLNLLQELSEAVTAEAALTLLQEAGLLKPAMRELGLHIDDSLRLWAGPEVDIGFVCFARGQDLPELLCCSANAPELVEIWREN